MRHIVSLSLTLCVYAFACCFFIYAFSFSHVQPNSMLSRRVASTRTWWQQPTVKMYIVNVYTYSIKRYQQQWQQQQMYTIFWNGSSQNICFDVRDFTTSQASQHFFFHAEFLISFFRIRSLFFFLLNFLSLSHFISLFSATSLTSLF